jgi:hypothetical protein
MKGASVKDEDIEGMREKPRRDSLRPSGSRRPSRDNFEPSTDIAEAVKFN